TKPIVGVVRDKDTKQPLQGVTIRSLKLANNPTHHFSDSGEFARTTSDAQGRYRLMGMPKGEGNKVMVVPPDDLPYSRISVDVTDSLGLDPVTLDVELKRGIWIEGKIIDKVTGKALQRDDMGVEYIPTDGNPNLRDYPGFTGVWLHFGKVKQDGSYRVVGLPG